LYPGNQLRVKVSIARVVTRNLLVQPPAYSPLMVYKRLAFIRLDVKSETSLREEIHFYNLFYYPPPPLLPRIMSEDDLSEVWCLINCQQEPCSVPISLEWNVDKLRKAIQRAKHDLLRLDISDIVLLKVRLSY
jgi:hypothetical protein